MTPDQFLLSLQKNGPAPVYLFLGPEPYQRERCRRALLEAVLGPAPEDRESGFTLVDLSEVPLSAALDHARALSLFATRRMIWIGTSCPTILLGTWIFTAKPSELPVEVVLLAGQALPPSSGRPAASAAPDAASPTKK